MQASGSSRALLGILAVTERHGLIAKESPPRLSMPPVGGGMERDTVACETVNPSISSSP